MGKLLFEEESYNIQGAIFEVYKELGNGFLEAVYQEALEIEFTKRNIQVSIPFGDNARYDLVAEFNGKLNKIQVKYSSQISKNNSVIIRTSSSTYHTTNKHENKYINDVVKAMDIPLDGSTSYLRNKYGHWCTSEGSS